MVVSAGVVRAQSQATSLGRVSTDAMVTKAGQAPGTTPAQQPDPDFFHQEMLTGDCNGARTRGKNKDVDLVSSLSQFYQGVSSGGTETGSEYTGLAQVKLDFDLGKLAGWNGGWTRRRTGRW